MTVTPLDLPTQQFKTSVRGFDRREVAEFLSEVAADYEDALREADRLRDDLGRAQSLVEEHREQERTLRGTLMTAQKLADDIRENAQQDAARITREAEGRSDLLLQKAQLRLEEVQRETDSLKIKRREAEQSLESIINTMKNTLEYVREQDARDRDDKIRLLRPRGSAEPAADTANDGFEPKQQQG